MFERAPAGAVLPPDGFSLTATEIPSSTMNNPIPTRASTGRRPWESPRVDDLPRLTELTLVTASPGIPGSGGTAGAGSTVIIPPSP